MKQDITEVHLIEMLSRRFPPPEWAFLSHVKSATGFVRENRTSDAICMNLWPSRGLEIHGFEIKCNRGDWLKELRNPRKAEDVAQFCDRWWLVVSDKSIVLTGELPGTWGLLVPFGKGLKCVKAPEKQSVIAVDRPFLAAVLRKTQEAIHDDKQLKAKYQEGLKDGHHRSDQQWQAEVDSVRGENNRLKREIEEFEKASGINLDKFTWHGTPEELGKAFRVALEGGTKLKRQIEHITTVRDRLTEMIDGFSNDSEPPL